MISYFTFGFDHVHEVLGRRFNHDTMVKLDMPNPRDVMRDLFGDKWAAEYEEEKALELAVKWDYEIVEIKAILIRELT